MSGWQTRDPAHVGLDPADYTSALPFPKLNGAGDGFEPDAGGGGSATSAVTVPEDHSAVGDGTTDDTTALQAWLDDARPFKFLPANTYITDSLTVPSDVVIFGGGDGSVLKRRGVPQPDGGVLNIFGGAGIVSGVTVANLTVDGNKANVTASGNALNVECIDIKDATGIRLHNVTLRDATSDGVDLDDCTDVVIYACHAYDCGGWGFHFSHGTVENKLVGSVADNCGHDQDRGGIDQWDPSGGNPGGLRNSYIGNTARDCYRNYAIRGSGAVFIGNQSLGTSTLADVTTGVVDAGGAVDLSLYPSAEGQPSGKVAETDGADGWTFIDTPTGGTGAVITVDPGTPTYTPNGEVSIAVSTVWGVDGDGLAYYDAGGVASGDEAALMRDPESEAWFLLPYFRDGVGLVAYPPASGAAEASVEDLGAALAVGTLDPAPAEG